MAGKLAAVGHAQISETENRAQYELKAERLRRALLKLFPHPTNHQLLDAGCGIGALTGHYANLGFSVTGVDFSETAIATARESGIGAHFEVGSLESLKLNREFDVVCVVDVLQHLVDDACCTRALASLSRHTKKEGFILLLDSMATSEVSAAHCHRRTLAWHEAEFRIVGLELIAQEQFTLAHENSRKHLLTFQRRH